jgi:two-component system cell cycle sensor histidine kinase PleC
MADADTRPRGDPPSSLGPDTGQTHESLVIAYLCAVSHEVRAPLAGVRGYTELLLSGTLGEVSDRQHQALSRIGHLGYELESMVENLILTAQRSVDGLKPFTESVSLTNIIERVVRRLHEPCVSRDVSVDLAYAATGSLWLDADPRLLERALTNIIGNAVAFSSDGGSVTVRVAEDGGNITVEVADRGSGIAEEELARLLGPVCPDGPPQTVGLTGPGLGLMVTDAVIRGHGGHLSVDSEPGTGTTVTITLPVRGPRPAVPGRPAGTRATSIGG